MKSWFFSSSLEENKGLNWPGKVLTLKSSITQLGDLKESFTKEHNSSN